MQVTDGKFEAEDTKDSIWQKLIELQKLTQTGWNYYVIYKPKN